MTLRSYVFRKYLAPSGNPKKKNDGPPRWRSWSIVRIAAIVLKHGSALRKALRLDGMAPEHVPTVRERAIAAEACVSELASENASLHALLAKCKDAKRKADERKAAAAEKKKAAKVAKAKAAKEKALSASRVSSQH